MTPESGCQEAESRLTQMETCILRPATETTTAAPTSGTLSSNLLAPQAALYRCRLVHAAQSEQPERWGHRLRFRWCALASGSAGRFSPSAITRANGQRGQDLFD